MRKPGSLLPAAALLIVSPLAAAHSFCVASAADLQAALDAASDGGAYNAEDNEVHLAPGVYNIADAGGQRFYFTSTAAHYLDIQGGWRNDCATLASDPAASVLDGNHSNAVIDLRSTQGSITIRNVTIRNGMWSSGTLAAGISINPVSGDLGFVSVTNTIIRDNTSVSTPGGIVGGANGISFINNLVVGNSTGGDAAAGEMFATGSTTINNNTITANTSSDANASGGLLLTGGSQADVSNNIIWNNSHIGLELTGNAVVLTDNDIGTIGGSGTPAPGSAGNVAVAPRFIGGGDYHLAGNSPLLAIGTPTPSGGVFQDLEGHSRPQTGAIDLGAYEETVFRDGFDG